MDVESRGQGKQGAKYTGSEQCRIIGVEMVVGLIVDHFAFSPAEAG